MRFNFHFLFIVFFGIAVFFLPSELSASVMDDFSVVKLQAIDKSTARTVTFQAKVGSTIQYGSLFIKTQSCRKSPPLEKPESAAFLQIWEVPVGKEKSEWIFSGWMFASSPALSAMDHPVYDVWVINCLSGDTENKEAKKSETKKQTADPAALEPVEGTPEQDNSKGKNQENYLEKNLSGVEEEKNIDDILNKVTEKKNAE